VTDVTGFGLLGHALEMARGSGLDAVIEPAALAWLPGVEAFAEAGVVTGASGRNWASYGEEVSGVDALERWRRDLLCDPQTSGGLLIAVAPDRAEALQALALSRGFAATRAVGRMESGVGGVRVARLDARP
jgi:selenide,water dikinase